MGGVDSGSTADPLSTALGLCRTALKRTDQLSGSNADTSGLKRSRHPAWRSGHRLLSDRTEEGQRISLISASDVAGTHHICSDLRYCGIPWPSKRAIHV